MILDILACQDLKTTTDAAHLLALCVIMGWMDRQTQPFSPCFSCGRSVSLDYFQHQNKFICAHLIPILCDPKKHTIPQVISTMDS